MSSIVALSGIEDVKEKLCNLSKDLDKYAPEHRNQVMVDRLRQQKLRAMISLAKAQQFLAETDVLIADYNLQAVADEFEHMKKERLDNTDMKPIQNSGSKEEKIVLSREYPTNSSKPSDICCTPLLPAEGNPKSKEKGTELIPKHNKHTEAHRSKSKIDAGYKINDSERMNKINEKSRVTDTSSKTHEPTSMTYKESSSKTKEAATSRSSSSSSKTKETATSKAHEPSSSKTKETATSKAHEPPSSKTKETATSKAHEPSSSKTKDTGTSKSSSSSKTKEAATSKTYEAVTSAKEAALADTDLPAPGLKRKKRKRSKSKSKDSKRHKSSHATTEVTAPTASSNVPTASLNVPTASSNVPTASSNVPTASVGSVATSKALSRASATALSDMPTSSHVSYLFAHVPNCDRPKIIRTDKEKTLLNTSISPIKKIVEHKRVQTDQKKFKNDIVQTDVVKTVTKGVQTDNVIILQVGGEPVVENSPFTDEDTLLLDTLPAPHSHTTAISLAKAFQQIKSEKTPAERLSPAERDVSEVLTRNELFQTTELMMEDEAESEGTARAVKAEVVDEELASTSTELLVNDLYKDIMKAKGKERDLKPKRRVTKRALWKVLDMC